MDGMGGERDEQDGQILRPRRRQERAPRGQTYDAPYSECRFGFPPFLPSMPPYPSPEPSFILSPHLQSVFSSATPLRSSKSAFKPPRLSLIRILTPPLLPPLPPHRESANRPFRHCRTQSSPPPPLPLLHHPLPFLPPFLTLHPLRQQLQQRRQQQTHRRAHHLQQKPLPSVSCRSTEQKAFDSSSLERRDRSWDWRSSIRRSLGCMGVSCAFSVSRTSHKERRC